MLLDQASSLVNAPSTGDVLGAFTLWRLAYAQVTKAAPN